MGSTMEGGAGREGSRGELWAIRLRGGAGTEPRQMAKMVAHFCRWCTHKGFQRHWFPGPIHGSPMDNDGRKRT